MRIKILNQQNESLDVLIEEPSGVIKATVIMAHGIGTNKHETDGMFDDCAKALVAADFRVVRFDFSGFGSSEGKSEDFDLKKGGEDLQSVIDWVRLTYKGQLHLVSQSMATAITCFHQPQGIIKTVFTAHVNPYDLVSGIKNRIMQRPGGKVDEQGISIYLRSSGEIQKFGPSFWLTLRGLDFMLGLKRLAEKTKLLVIRPQQDEIIILDNTQLDIFRNQKEFAYVEIPGDHSFRGQQSRAQLCQAILSHLNTD